MSHSINTLTFFRFRGLHQKVWAFRQMGLAHADMQCVDGLTFYRLMGSGKAVGFSPFPDWGVYALLAVWKNQASAERFFQTANLYQQYVTNSCEHWTIYLRTRKSKGLWAGHGRFQPSTQIDETNTYVAVITRATIRWRRMVDFWQYVPSSQLPIQNGCEGLIFAKGIGEMPITQMATFSLWENLDAVKSFAYQSREHRVAIEKTHQLDWYSEELFARFQPYRSIGTWGDQRPLPMLSE